MNQLQSEGVTCVAVDLTMIGSKDTTIERWYGSFIYKLASNLQLLSKFNFRAWWQELDFLSSVEKLREFIDQNDTPEIQELLLSGLVSIQQGKLKISNRIYEAIFDSDWIKRHLD